MSLIFDYICFECGDETDSSRMESFACKCGGTYVLKKAAQVRGSFKPYLNESHNVVITSAAQERKFIKKHGAPIGEFKSIVDKMKWTRRNKEDIIASRYASIGLKYPKGKKVTLDEKTGRFIPRAA